MKKSTLLRAVSSLVVALAFTLAVPPSVMSATGGSTSKVVKKLKKQVRTLKKQLATAQRPAPVTVPFIQMVDVTENGNAPDTSGYGAVAYNFKMAKYETTLNQYVEFLNAVAATDSYNLYNPNMEADSSVAGIRRSGDPGDYAYSVIGDGNRPVTYVSWFDAARFCNWLHNGRPAGLQNADTTEDGAYNLNGAIAGLGFTRLWGAKYWIPSEDEWYKAAFFDPRDQASGGPSGNDNYWLYTTMRETAPGNAIGSSPNQANIFNGTYSVTPGPNRLSAVGAYTNSPTYFGTFDQGGSLWEWNDAIINVDFRGQRSGSWDNDANTLRSLERGQNFPQTESNLAGFRIAGQ